MNKIIAFLPTLILAITLTACSTGDPGTGTGVNSSQNSATTGSSASTAVPINSRAGSVAASSTGAASVAEALAENQEVNEDPENYVW